MSEVQEYLDQRAAKEAKEQELNELALQLYKDHNRAFVPRYPWVFVRVLPKEQQVGSIIVPDIEQNKTIHEGIVLATWEPVEYELEMKRTIVQTGPGYSGGQGVATYMPTPSAKFRRESALKASDHVIFPHWAGLPVEGFSRKHYRVVKEEGWKESQDGGIFAHVDYGPKDTRPEEVLRTLLETRDSRITWEIEIDDLVDMITKRFLLVDRDAKSVTLSGR